MGSVWGGKRKGQKGTPWAGASLRGAQAGKYRTEAN